MSNDPLVIGLSQVIELLRGIGLDPVEPRDLRAIHITPEGITVVRTRRDEDGHAFVVGDEIATETVTIRLENSR